MHSRPRSKKLSAQRSTCWRVLPVPRLLPRHGRHWERFVAALTAELKGLGAKRTVRLINARHYDRVKAMLAEHHGTNVPPPSAPDDDGLPRCDGSSRAAPTDAIMREEIFGPIRPVLRVRTIADAIQQANTSPAANPSSVTTMAKCRQTRRGRWHALARRDNASALSPTSMLPCMVWATLVSAVRASGASTYSTRSRTPSTSFAHAARLSQAQFGVQDHAS